MNLTTLNYLNSLSVQQINEASGKAVQFTMHQHKIEIDVEGQYVPAGQLVHQPVDSDYCILLIVHRSLNLVHGLITEREKVQPLLKNMRHMWRLPRVTISRDMNDIDDNGMSYVVYCVKTDGRTEDFEIFIAESRPVKQNISGVVDDAKYFFTDARIFETEEKIRVPHPLLGCGEVLDI